MDLCYVVVRLKRAKRLVIMKENWIQDLLNAKLRNNGRNSNQDFLVFWSATNNIANWNTPPDFNAPLTQIYEPTSVDGVCYIGRVVKFAGK